jgi:hypothetical protein
MAQTLENDIPFSTDFSGGITSLQCMGSSAYTPETNPNGIAGSIEIDDGWCLTTVRDTDPPTATGIRAELTMPVQAMGDEAWFSWEMMVKSGEWNDIENGDMSVSQCHPKNGINASGYFNFFIRPGGRLTFAYPETEPPTEGSYVKTHIDIEELRFDHVYKCMIHTIWVAEAGRGFLEAFLDGRQIYKTTGRGTAYVDDLPYAKVGIYDAPHAADFGTKAIRYRNLKRWSGSGPYSTVLGDAPRSRKLLVGP